MKKKTKKKPDIRIRKKTRRGRPRKIAKPVDKTKLAFQEIRNEFKRLKKSKQKMQFLWYRTKKEHVALMRDLDKQIKKLKAEIRNNKRSKKKSVTKRDIKKTINKMRHTRKHLTKKPNIKKIVVKKPKEDVVFPGEPESNKLEIETPETESKK